MRTTLTAALAAAAAIPLTFLAAAPALAAPGDVTAVFTTTPNPGGSNTVTGTFTTTGSAKDCTMVDYFNRGADNGLTLFGQKSADPSSTSITVTDTDVPDGTYTINWFCNLDSGIDGTTYYPFGTQEPTTLVVPTVVAEEPGCTGSVCLPTGSFFGF